MSESKARAVLAHGAWADGSSWNKVIAGLRSEGVKAVAAPLPLTSLADDVSALDRTLERIDGPVVVVGHAYAGAVIASTDDENVASLVYVAALAPDEGETVADVFYRTEPHPQAPPTRPRPPRADLATGGRLRQGLRAARLARGAGTAGRYPAAARGGMHRDPGGASGVEGPAELVPGGRGGPHDPRGEPAVHGRAHEGAGAHGSRRPPACAHAAVRGRRHRAGSGAGERPARIGPAAISGAD